ncbi:MAG: metalloregulator ArsR/SmtB family transcription factor [Candidatus Omnitrophota bacterium]
MRLKKARQMLKSFADDTRLRIVNLLSRKELSVSELCEIIGSTQPNVSKHLARLRLTGIVGDRRNGNSVYYRLSKPADKARRGLINAVTSGLSELETFRMDRKRLNSLKERKRNV